ncbi:hypothetical protein HK101_002611, partial [Irineochytrium annulatum]
MTVQPSSYPHPAPTSSCAASRKRHAPYFHTTSAVNVTNTSCLQQQQRAGDAVPRRRKARPAVVPIAIPQRRFATCSAAAAPLSNNPAPLVKLAVPPGWRPTSSPFDQAVDIAMKMLLSLIAPRLDEFGLGDAPMSVE